MKMSPIFLVDHSAPISRIEKSVHNKCLLLCSMLSNWTDESNAIRTGKVFTASLNETVKVKFIASQKPTKTSAEKT